MKKRAKRKTRKDNLGAMDLDREQCRRAADAILESFVWRETKEGTDFWDDIYHRFLNLANTK